MIFSMLACKSGRVQGKKAASIIFLFVPDTLYIRLHFGIISMCHIQLQEIIYKYKTKQFIGHFKICQWC